MAAKKKPKPKNRAASKAKPVEQAAPAAPVVAKVDAHQWTDGGNRVLILKRINADGASYCGFSAWGKIGEPCEVTAPDWNNRQECGGGLHGWPWGMGLGDGSGYSIIEDRWLVLAAKPEDVVGELDKGLKCKARSVHKIYDGVFAGAWALINSGRHRLIDAMAKSGLPNCATGFQSTSASSGNYSTSASSGDYSKSASSGDYSKSASSGNYSKSASSGNYSKSEQIGKSGIAASIGNGGLAKAGEDGCLIVCWWSKKESRYRACVGYVGENGIKANTWYRVADGKLVEV